MQLSINEQQISLKPLLAVTLQNNLKQTNIKHLVLDSLKLSVSQVGVLMKSMRNQ